MSEMKNVDDVLVKSMNEQLAANNQPPRPEPPTPATIAPVPKQEEKNEQDDYGIEPPLHDNKQPESDNKETASSENKQNEDKKPLIDEYGNPVDKPKMYTEDELQGILRERISRIKSNQQPTNQELKEIRKDFHPDVNSEESWETQLEDFIEKTVDKREKKRHEEEWRSRELQKQTEFEEKFTNGMEKYKDFREVVAGKPITDTMMLATRELENPASFIYAASKLHPKELERIANIKDHYTQAAEIGRLHEKMIRTKHSPVNTRPIDVPKGDMPAKSSDMPSLESRIQSYAEQKRRR